MEKGSVCQDARVQVDETVYATIEGFAVMRMIRKRQCILLEPGITGEVPPPEHGH